MDKKTFNRKFVTYLREIRTNKGLTQMDVASILCVNPQNILAIERGEVAPTFYWVSEYCLKLEINEADFFNNFFIKLKNDN